MAGDLRGFWYPKSSPSSCSIRDRNAGYVVRNITKHTRQTKLTWSLSHSNTISFTNSLSLPELVVDEDSFYIRQLMSAYSDSCTASRTLDETIPACAVGVGARHSGVHDEFAEARTAHSGSAVTRHRILRL